MEHDEADLEGQGTGIGEGGVEGQSLQGGVNRAVEGVAEGRWFEVGLVNEVEHVLAWDEGKRGTFHENTVERVN